MKIMMTADMVGGVWTYSLELARILENDNVEVHLVTMGGRMSEAQRAEAHSISNLKVYESSFKLEWMEDPWEEVEEAGNWLLQMEDIIEPDIIHLNGYVHAALPFEAPVLVVAHSCVLSWWQAVKNEPAPESWNEYKTKVQHGLESAAVVISPSNYMLNEIHRHYGENINGRVIYNGRDTTLFQPADKDEFILCVGRIWDEGKNLELLHDIANRLIWRLFIAGDNNSPDAGKKKLLTDEQYLGAMGTAEVSEWLSKAGIFALPAVYEPFGLSALEAALSGCPLVLSDIPSLREIWKDAAIFVDPHDGSAWTHMLNTLAEDDQMRKKYADKALKRAKNFTAEAMGKNYLELYKGLILERNQKVLAEDRV